MPYDAIVIGAGLAGMIGALRLAEAGRRVLVLAKGHGATHWAAGTIDVAPSARPLEEVARLATSQPDHPYARGGVAALTAATDRLRSLCDAANYPLVGTLERTLHLPTAAGAARPTTLAPRTMAAGALDGHGHSHDETGPLLLASFREFRDFSPALAAANLRAQGFAARAATLTLPPTRRALDFPTTVFARLFEDAAFRANVGRQLRALRGDARAIGLPALLGLGRAGEVHADLEGLSGRPIFEIPTLPPSVPGIRLYDILAAALLRAGGRIQLGGWVTRAEADGDRLCAIASSAAAREQRHSATCYLLATGGILGGGLRAGANGVVRETVLDLAVRAPATRDDWFAPRMLAADGQPIYQAGIATDSALRPLDAANHVVYANVAVAGAALGGADLIREGCAEGVALATGWQAADCLLDYLGQPATTPAPATRSVL